MPKYSFKSSGRNASEEKTKLDNTIDSITLTPISIKTPLELSYDGLPTLFEMHTDYGDFIHDNLRNMLLTNNGERLGQYDFGGSLRELTFELINSPNFESLIMSRIRRTVEKYMPYVDLESFTSEKIDIGGEEMPEKSSLVKVSIRIEYSVPQISVMKKGLELILYVGG